MESDDPRAALEALIEQRGESYAALSRLLGRNPAYLQQFVRRGTPRVLAERDRALLARYLGVDETRLGGPPLAKLVRIPRLDIAASAGPGRWIDQEHARDGGFDPALLRALGVREAAASIIRVAGDSMLPMLAEGDEILVDGDRRAVGARGGLFVLRHDGALMVKRLEPDGDRLAIVSDNRDWPVMRVAARQIEILGRVVWLGRALG